MLRFSAQGSWYHHLRCKQIIRYLSNDVPSQKLPSQAEIIIAGGGVIGTSVAYHLSELGWKDILVLEQGSVGGGTSWHSAGMCGSIRSTYEETQNMLYGMDLYTKFEEEYGIGFKKCGSIGLAKSYDRAFLLQKTAVKSRQFGAICETIDVKEAKKLNPFMTLDDIKLCLHSPNDGVVNPTDLIQAYLRRATSQGRTKCLEGVEIKRVESDGKFVTSVETNFGKIACNVFINCGGLWARQVGQLSDPPVEVPLHASEHFYIVTKPIENVHSMLPVVRDYDARTYVREWSGGLMCGGFEPEGKPCFYNGTPEKFEFQLLPEDWEQFEYFMDGLIKRFPCLEDAEVRQFVNGPESFTPDGFAHACKSMEFQNYFIAAGMGSKGIVSSAGVGRTISELVTYGETTVNSQICDVRRMPKGSNNLFYLRDTTVWSLRSFYELIYPVMSVDNCRNFMTSPLHGWLDQHNAVWGQISNWEIPKYFAKGKDERMVHTFGKPNWLNYVQHEINCCRNTAGIIDLSAKSKFEVSCSDAKELSHFLKLTCLGDVDTMTNGNIIDTAVLNDKKECQSLVSLLKVNENKCMIITSPEQHTRLLSSLKESTESQNIVIEDISGKYALLGLLGPYSEDLLNELLAPPYKTHQIQDSYYKTVDIGYASNVHLVRHIMNRVTGWQLIVPTEFSQGLYRQLMSYGEKFDLQNVGLFALESIRIENMVPAYGFEIDATTEYTFLNKILNHREIGKTQSLHLLEMTVPSTKNWPWGEEPVMLEDNLVGNLTSVGYTQSDDKLLGLVVSSEDLEHGQKVSVQCGLEVYHATVISRSKSEPC